MPAEVVKLNFKLLSVFSYWFICSAGSSCHLIHPRSNSYRSRFKWHPVAIRKTGARSVCFVFLYSAAFCFLLLPPSFSCFLLHCFAQSNFHHYKNECTGGKQDTMKMVLFGPCSDLVRVLFGYIRTRSEEPPNMVRRRYEGGSKQVR